MELKDIHSVYFLGIGGIGMSALARWFNANDYAVAGYDKTSSPLTDSLISEGIVIHFDDNIDSIAETWKNKETTLVVYTPAVAANHSELNFFIQNGFNVKKRAEVLGMLTSQYFTIAVAGTHGKTTTSSMVAHILHHSGVNTMAFVGGISQNYNSNLILNDKNAENPIVVVEADEFDRSFLHLSPDIAIVTTVDPDHLDIYNDQEDLENTFKKFVDKVPAEGLVVYNKKSCSISLEEIQANKTSYGLTEGDVQAKSIKVVDGEQIFDFEGKESINGLELALPGFHNIQNALAAIAVCLEVGVSREDITKAIMAYRGVKRRFEYVIKSPEIVYIDDYAHHPSELAALIDSVHHLFPKKKVTLIFQPHLFSRTKDFMNEFAEVLAQVDELFLLDIYPARELPIEGVTSKVLFDKIDLESKTLSTGSSLLQDLSGTESDLVITAGAGDIAMFVNRIKNLLVRK